MSESVSASSSFSAKADLAKNIISDYKDRYLHSGDHYFANADYEKAHYYYKKNHKKVSSRNDNDKIILAEEKLAETLYKMGKTAEALQHYRRARELLRKVMEEKKEDNRYVNWFSAMSVNCGNLCLVVKDYDNAIANYKEALPLIQQELEVYDPYVVAIVKNHCTAREKLAEQYVRKNLYNLAIEHYEEAQRLRRPYLQQRDSTEQYKLIERTFLKRVMRIGQLHLEQNKPDQAIVSFSEMLSTLGIDSLDDIPVPNMVVENEHLIANILHNFGVIYEQAENYDDAALYYEKSLSVKKSLLSSDDYHNESLIGTVGKSLLGLGLSFYRMNRDDRAFHCLNEAKNILQMAKTSSGYDINEPALLHLAKIHAHRKEFDDCIACLDEIVKLAIRCFGENSEKEVIARRRIAKIQYRRGQTDQALESYFLILRIQVKMHGNINNKDASSTLSRIGTIYALLGNNEKAVEFYMESLLGADDDNSKLFVWTKLAEIYNQMQSTHQALECYRSALSFTSQPEHISFLMNNMGTVHCEIGNLEAAQSCFTEALSMCSQISDKNKINQKQSGISYNLGKVLFLRKLYEDSQQVLENLLQEQLPHMLSFSQSPGHLDMTKIIASALNSVGNIYFERKLFKEAADWFNESMGLKEVFVKNEGKASKSYAGTLSNLSSSYIKLGQFDDALHSSEQAMRIVTSLRTEKKMVAALWCKKGIVYAHKNQPLAAMDYYFTSLQMMQNNKDSSNENNGNKENLLVLRHNIALMLCKMGRFDEAKDTLNDIHQIRMARKTKNHPDVSELLLDLGCIHYAERNYHMAKRLISSALQSFLEARLPETHPLVGRARYVLKLVDQAILYESQAQKREEEARALKKQE